jgi:hypothetical protein
MRSMKKILFSGLIIFFSGVAFGQIYKAEKQLSPGVCDEVVTPFSKSINGKLYYRNWNEIHKYENGILFKYPECPKHWIFSDTVLLNDIEEFNSNLYIAGPQFKIGNDFYSICYFDGTNWNGLPASKGLTVYQLCTAGAFLYFKTNDGDIYKVDKSGNKILIGNRQRFDNGWLIKFQKTNIIIQDSFHVFKYDGSQWDSVKSSKPGKYEQQISDSDSDVYMRADKYLFKLNKSFQIEMLDSTLSTSYSQLIGVLDNHIYFYIYDINGFQAKAYNLKTRTTTDVFKLKYIFSARSSFNRMYFLMHENKIGSKVKIFEAVDGVLVQGNVFEDKNLNCNRDAGENPLSKLKVTYKNGSNTFLSFSDDTGYYKISVIPGSFTVNVEKKYLKTMSDSCVGTKSFSYGKTYSEDIPYRINNSIKDIGAMLIADNGFQARRGFTGKYNVVYEKYASTSENFTIELEYPDSVTFISSDLSPRSHAGRKLTFVVNNVKRSEIGKFGLQFQVHPKKQLNSIIYFICNTYSNINDLDSTNNEDILKQTIKAAIDPNIKQSSPEGYVETPVSKIRYHIQFQNEGNHAASRVVVVDTIDGRLPIRKLQMIDCKHMYTLRVENGNVLIWEFDNINLLPKTDGEEASKGYIIFEAPLSKPLQIGESVLNRAHIYFDYEDPLPTPFSLVAVGSDPNSVMPIINKVLGIEVYPNPFNNQITISGNNELGEVSVFNTLGVQVFQKKIEESNYKISTENWAKGIYVLKFHAQNTSMKILKL